MRQEISLTSFNMQYACFIGGPNPALRSDHVYSQKYYEHVSGKYKDLSEVSKYRSIFIDSNCCITFMSFMDKNAT